VPEPIGGKRKCRKVPKATSEDPLLASRGTRAASSADLADLPPAASGILCRGLSFRMSRSEYSDDARNGDVSRNVSRCKQASCNSGTYMRAFSLLRLLKKTIKRYLKYM